MFLDKWLAASDEHRVELCHQHAQLLVRLENSAGAQIRIEAVAIGRHDDGLRVLQHACAQLL